MKVILLPIEVGPGQRPFGGQATWATIRDRAVAANWWWLLVAGKGAVTWLISQPFPDERHSRPTSQEWAHLRCSPTRCSHYLLRLDDICTAAARRRPCLLAHLWAAQPARFPLDIAGSCRQLVCGVPAIAIYVLGVTPGAGGLPGGIGLAKMHASPRPGPCITVEMSIEYYVYIVTMDD